jgi:PAS domain S-box-containing protein
MSAPEKIQENQGQGILYVEDNLADRIALERALHHLNFPFKVDSAPSFREAVSLLSNRKYQAVVSDFYLGDAEALDLFPFIGDSPLIIITGEGSEENAVKALQAGAYDYLIKDINQNYLKILPITVTKTIEQKRQRDELGRYRNQLENLVEERTNELIGMFAKVRESETNFRNIFNGTSDGILISDKDYNLLEANDTLLKLFNITKELLVTHKVTDFILPSFRNALEQRREPSEKRLSVKNMEIEIKSPYSDQVIPAEVSSVPVVFNNQPAVLTIVRDITERRFLARRLIETIIQTEESERSRIARDLHDEIGPLISALKIYMTAFIEHDNIEKKNNLAVEMGVIIRDMIDSVKNISNDMSPHILVNFGLLAALQNIIELFSKTITIQLETNLNNTRFPGIVESVFYRVIKELINNTLKHGRASFAEIVLRYERPFLLCSYKDNGVGFDLAEYSDAQVKGMGLSNIKTRLQSLGGQLEIITSPGQGITVNISLKTNHDDLTNP